MTPRTVVSALAVAALTVLPGTAEAWQATPQAAPGLEYEGAVATGIALRRLGNTARLLHVGAHPDDENTAIFSPLVLGRGANAAYLSVNRGEGGQNGIGSELGIPLGLIRSEELLAARRLDGAMQFFTRAIDYGFSKDAAEAFRHWPRDSLLADVVAVIRRYRPDVVIPAWTGTPRDGHGQHQAAGILTREAVLAAGDPSRFPEQIAAGLRPHTPRAYYWSARYGPDGADVEMDTGLLDPLLGHSYHQVAMASRSRHRSQDMGVPQAPGPRHTAFDEVDPAAPPGVAMRSSGGRQLEGRAAEGASLFAGLDTLLSQRAGRVPGLAPGRRDRLAEHFVAYERAVDAARQGFQALASGGTVPLLLEARTHLEAAEAALSAAAGTSAGARGNDAIEELRFHVAAEAGDLRDAVIAAANIRVDVESDEELVVANQTFRLRLSVWNGGPGPIEARVEPLLPDGWTARAAGPGTAESSDSAAAELRVGPGERTEVAFDVRVPGTAEATRPYFLDKDDSADGRDVYDWPADYGVRGLPFAPDPVRGRFAISIPGPAATGAATGNPFIVERDAAWIGVEARSGEYRRPVAVVPRLSVQVEPRLAAIPVAAIGEPGHGPLTFNVVVRNDGPDGTAASVLTAAPEGWTATPERVELAVVGAGAERTVSFEMSPPPGVAPGEYLAGALVEVPGCGGASQCATIEGYAHGYDLIDYPHVAPHRLYRPAEARVRVLDVKVAGVQVGYVAGVGDGVPEALEQMGVAWTPLGATDLASGDLSGFDVIIAGTRAYELRPDLVAHNERLLDWARAGGALISLYNKYPALSGSFAPWPVTIARPHGRVTDEAAPVNVLEPDHPLFNSPNRIGPADWEGWVQERGLYFWDTWGGPLRPLLAMSDPGEAPLRGSLLFAPLGEGTYVYTALALFRQLPEGVPGAYRLLANLVSLGAAR